MKSGMTLLEVVVALAISSILATALYNSFAITGKVALKSDERMHADVKFSTIHHVLNRDIQSIFIPRSFDKPSAAHAQAASPQKEAPKKESKPLKDIFSMKRLADGTQIITFITTNYFIAEVKNDQQRAQSRIGRVVYRFERDPEHENSYILYRQEAPNLSLKAFEKGAKKPIKAFEVVRGIKSWRITSRYPVEFKAPPKIDEKREYKTVEGWPLDSLKNAPTIPQFMTIAFELWQDDYQHSEELVMPLEIASFYASVMTIQEEKKPAPSAPKKEVNAQTFQELANKVQEHLAKTVGNIPGLQITMHRLK